MVKIENISKTFGSKIILDGLSLELNEGEILSVIGKSGTGKSVLLKCIIGLEKVDSGSILIDDERVTDFNEREFNERIRPKMSMIFQQGALWDSMTIEENIDLALKIRKNLPEDERRQLVRESLELVDLKGVEKMYPDELSGGMAKRAAFARGAAIRPKYLLYDEPTTGLDPVLSNIINDLIVELNQKLGTTSLVISHDIQGVEHISHRIAMLYKGNILLTCDKKDLWNQNNAIFNHFIHGDITLL